MSTAVRVLGGSLMLLVVREDWVDNTSFGGFDPPPGHSGTSSLRGLATSNAWASSDDTRARMRTARGKQRY